MTAFALAGAIASEQRSFPWWKPLLALSAPRSCRDGLVDHRPQAFVSGCGVHLAGVTVHDEPVRGLLVDVSEIQFVFVPPCPHVFAPEEGQVEPVVGKTARRGLTIIEA